jgi:hypothetical protein
MSERVLHFKCKKPLKTIIEAQQSLAPGNGVKVLELGSGTKSTPFFCEHLAAKRIRTFVSLESNEDWLNKVKNHPNVRDVSVVVRKSDFVLDEATGRLQYDFRCNPRLKFDIVLIDGPGPINKEFTDHLLDFINQPSCCLKGKRKGTQSIYLLDYVMPMTHPGSAILVDGRAGAVAHYMTEHGDKFNFTPMYEPYSPEFVNFLVTSAYVDRIVELNLSKITLITYKGDAGDAVIRKCQ